jgi:hypothetical protein
MLRHAQFANKGLSRIAAYSCKCITGEKGECAIRNVSSRLFLETETGKRKKAPRNESAALGAGMRG